MKPFRQTLMDYKYVTVSGSNIDVLMAALGRMKDVIGNQEYTMSTDGGEIVITVTRYEPEEKYQQRLEAWQQQENKKLDSMQKKVLAEKQRRLQLYQELKKEFE